MSDPKKQANYVRQSIAVRKAAAKVESAQADVDASAGLSQTAQKFLKSELNTAQKTVEREQNQLANMSADLPPEWTVSVDAMGIEELEEHLESFKLSDERKLRRGVGKLGAKLVASDRGISAQVAEEAARTREHLRHYTEHTEGMAEKRAENLTEVVGAVSTEAKASEKKAGKDRTWRFWLLFIPVIAGLLVGYANMRQRNTAEANAADMAYHFQQEDKARDIETQQQLDVVLGTVEALPAATRDIVHDEIANLPKPQKVDLGPLTQAVAETRADVLNAQAQVIALGGRVDGLGTQLGSLSDAVASNGQRIDQGNQDVVGLREEVGGIAGATRLVVQEEIKRIPRAQQQSVDLSEIERRLGAIEDGQRATTARVDGLVTVISNQSVTTQVWEQQTSEIVWVKQNLPAGSAVFLCDDGEFRAYSFDSVWLSSDAPDKVKFTGGQIFGEEGQIVPVASVRAGLGALVKN